MKAYFGVIKVNVFIYDDFFTTTFDSDDIPQLSNAIVEQG
jgi:hypothetical protein